MATFQDALNSFLNTYPRCSSTEALTLLNQSDEEILFRIPLRKSAIDLPLVAGQQEYTIDESVIRIWSINYFNSYSSRLDIAEATIDELDVYFPQWRSFTNSDPQRWYTSVNSTQGTIGLVPPPQYSTLLISNVTAASPAVVTTSTAHGLSTGAKVLITDVGGMTGVNQDWGNPWTITVLSTTTFSLNSSSASGTYTSATGYVTGYQSPRITLYCTQRLTSGGSAVSLTGSSTAPLTPQIRDLYADCMRWKYAKEKVPDEAMARKMAYDDSLALQLEEWMKRTGREQPKLRLVNQRKGWRHRGSSTIPTEGDGQWWTSSSPTN